MPDDDRARLRRLSRDPLQPARAAHAVSREPADLLAEVGSDRGDGVIVVGLDAHDARRLRRTEPDREHGPEHQWHLPEDVAGKALADDALDAVDELDRFDATLEHGKERALVTLVRGVLARHEADVRRPARQQFALVGPEAGEQLDAADLVRRHHAMANPTAAQTPPRRRAGPSRCACMADLEIELLGGFRVTAAGPTIPQEVWRRRKTAALVKPLALSPRHQLHREQVMDVLWPELAPAAAAANLRNALHYARRASADANGADLISSVGGLLCLPSQVSGTTSMPFERPLLALASPPTAPVARDGSCQQYDSMHFPTAHHLTPEPLRAAPITRRT